MATTTTLMTFLVRAPPSTRSVQLYGSWDNFTTPYAMQRDKRVGPEHWSGCHKFTNIICDGDPSNRSRSRNGGLKMGGTYWYYYTLNDEIEFHNSAQPSTTACPLLPGQLVNVLQVPFALSGNRSRNPSVSSTSSDKRTMNPEDKFLCPRPVPTPPKLYRLNTSPTLLQEPVSASAWTALPSSETAAKFFKLPRKVSIDNFTSPNVSKSNGLRAAFRVRNARSQSPDPLTTRMQARAAALSQHKRAVSVERDQGLEVDGGSSHGSLTSSRGLLLRSRSEDAIPSTNSFQQHRRERSRSREPSSLRNSFVNEDVAPLITNLPSAERHQPLGTLTEVASAQNTPLWPSERGTSSSSTESDEPDLGKRLPTLPNTPSSAYPASNPGTPEKKHENGLQNIESHFSTTTIDSDAESRFPSLAMNEESHFSFFSTTTAPVSATSSRFENTSPSTEPGESEISELVSPLFDEQRLPSELSNSTLATLSSTGSSSPSTSYCDNDRDLFGTPVEQTPLTSVSAAMRIQHYSLPEDEYSSAVTLKHPETTEQIDSNTTGGPSVSQLEVRQYDSNHLPLDAVVHSESMQRLLDELSYLSEMIQH